MALKPAYLAGLFDGEGSVGITCRHEVGKSARHLLQVSMSNTCLRVLEACRDHFGGCIHQVKPSALSRKTCWSWGVSAIKAGAFLDYIREDSIIKKEQIEIALTFQQRLNEVQSAHGRQRHVFSRWKPGLVTTPEEIGIRSELATRLKAAKQQDMYVLAP